MPVTQTVESDDSDRGLAFFAEVVMSMSSSNFRLTDILSSTTIGRRCLEGRGLVGASLEVGSAPAVKESSGVIDAGAVVVSGTGLHSTGVGGVSDDSSIGSGSTGVTGASLMILTMAAGVGGV